MFTGEPNEPDEQPKPEKAERPKADPLDQEVPLDGVGDFLNCTFGAMLRNHATGHLIYVGLPCRRWKCLRCRKNILISEWVDHFREKLQEMRERTVYRLEVDPEDWDKTAKLIRAIDGKETKHRFFKIRYVVDGVIRYRIYTPAYVPGAKRLTIAEAIQAFEEDLNKTQSSVRTVSTSRKWKKSEDKASKFEIVEIGLKWAPRLAEQVADEFDLKLEGADNWLTFEKGRDERIDVTDRLLQRAIILRFKELSKPNYSIQHLHINRLIRPRMAPILTSTSQN